MATAHPTSAELRAADPLSRLPTDLDMYRDPKGALARLPTDEELPYSDGEPMDSHWHRTAVTLLLDSLSHHRRGRTDYFAGGDMFLYFSPEYVFHKDFRGPDFFVVNGAPLQNLGQDVADLLADAERAD